jgi:hypothetical protein
LDAYENARAKKQEENKKKRTFFDEERSLSRETSVDPVTASDIPTTRETLELESSRDSKKTRDGGCYD